MHTINIISITGITKYWKFLDQVNNNKMFICEQEKYVSVIIGNWNFDKNKNEEVFCVYSTVTIWECVKDKYVTTEYAGEEINIILEYFKNNGYDVCHI